MIVLPAIDLKDGACVRLVRGDFDTAHKVAEDALEVARAFYAAGARYIHMVDLDGALTGAGRNRDTVRQVAAETGLQVELGGGLRSMADLDQADALGVYRMVIGSAAVTDPDFVAAAVAKYGPRIAVGIDAKDGLVRTKGWTENSGLNALEFAQKIEGMGVKTIIFTDIDTDGTLSGPPIERLRALRQAVNCQIIASGGVTHLMDIHGLLAVGVDGVIIGKAYYAGTISLEAAIALAGPQA